MAVVTHPTLKTAREVAEDKVAAWVKAGWLRSTPTKTPETPKEARNA